MRIKNLLDSINTTNKSMAIALSLLYISCVLVVIPFINVFVIRGFWLVVLVCLALGIGVFSLTFFCFYLFCKLQSQIKDLSVKEVIVKGSFILAFEYAFFAIFSFLTMLFPPLFMALGIVLVLVFCACNIYVMYNAYLDRVEDKQAFFRFSKIFNISAVTILVVIWLIC